MKRGDDYHFTTSVNPSANGKSSVELVHQRRGADEVGHGMSPEMLGILLRIECPCHRQNTEDRCICKHMAGDGQP